MGDLIKINMPIGAKLRIAEQHLKQRACAPILSGTVDGDVSLVIRNGEDEVELLFSPEESWELIDMWSDLLLDMAARSTRG